MVLQAFIDGSWDDGDHYALAGYIADADQWSAFAREWEALLPTAVKDRKTGKFFFKMSRMASTGKMDAVPGFYEVIERRAAVSVSCIINKREIKEELDRLVCTVGDHRFGEVEINLEPYLKKWRDPFFFSFRALMDTFHKAYSEPECTLPISGPVDFIFDEEQANETYIREVWDEYLSWRSDAHRPMYGQKPLFLNDDLFLPLQAADFRAWWVRKWANELGPERMAEGTYPFPEAERQPRHMFIWCGRDQIQKMVAVAMANALKEAIQLGLPIPPKSFANVRYWPRDPL